MCTYCIHAHCFPSVCRHNRCCRHQEPSQNSSDTSVSALVNAALGQLKAGNTLKFNVNIKNPQAIIDEAEALKGTDVSDGLIKMADKGDEGYHCHCRPHCHCLHHHCYCHHDSEEPTNPTKVIL